MARIINQNNEVIATKNSNGKKASVSKTSFIVGLALAIAAIAIIIVVILFVTAKEKPEENKKKTPLLQYIENYSNNNKNNPKIQVLSNIGSITSRIGDFDGECYILVYDVDWMTKNEIDSDLYKAYDTIDSYLTGKPKSDGTTIAFDSMLDAIQNCGQDIKFFVIDMNSIAKSDSDAEKNPEYFKSHNGISFQSLKAPMLFHYIDSEEYDDMNDKDLLIVDGNSKAGQWGSVVRGQVNYLNNIDKVEE